MVNLSLGATLTAARTPYRLPELTLSSVVDGSGRIAPEDVVVIPGESMYPGRWL